MWQVFSTIKNPCWTRIAPAPLQVGQVVGLELSLEPEPLQLSHLDGIVKLISSTQIISVGHPFKYPLDMSQFTNESDVIEEVSKNSESLTFKISDYSWKINRFLLKFIGSTYLFSITALFMILFIITLTKTKFNLKKEFIVFLFLSHMLNLAILSISFVSDEAMYVFPIMYISYLIMINDIKLKNKDESKTIYFT